MPHTSELKFGDNVFSVLDERTITCPENLPRKLLRHSPTGISIASIDEKGEIKNPAEATLHTTATNPQEKGFLHSLILLKLLNQMSFRCHDCPAVNQACITNILKLHRDEFNRSAPAKNQTQNIFNQIEIIPTVANPDTIDPEWLKTQDLSLI